MPKIHTTNVCAYTVRTCVFYVDGETSSYFIGCDGVTMCNEDDYFTSYKYSRD